MIYPYNGILFGNLKKVVLIYASTLMNVENIMLSDKVPHIVGFHLYEMSRIGKSIETENGFLGLGGLGGRNRELQLISFFFLLATMQDQGSNLCPLQWKRRVLTSGPPWKLMDLEFLFGVMTVS